MQLQVLAFPENNYFHELAELMKERNLVYYASEAVTELSMEDPQEIQDAIKRAMEACLAGGLLVSANFKRVFKATAQGIVFDWKLSVLAYNLVKLNCNPANPNVAAMQIELLKRI